MTKASCVTKLGNCASGKEVFKGHDKHFKLSFLGLALTQEREERKEGTTTEERVLHGGASGWWKSERLQG